MSYKIVSLDFDHTITARDTAIEHVAKKMDIESLIQQAEDDFRSGNIDTTAFTDLTAGCFEDFEVESVNQMATDIPLLPGAADMITTLIDQDIYVIINTVGYKPLLQPISDRLGLHAVSGAELETQDGIYTGNVVSYFSIVDKISFAAQFAHERLLTLDDVIAIGDGLSDVPLFEAVGCSIAFNANKETRAKADHAITASDADDLSDFVMSLVAK